MSACAVVIIGPDAILYGLGGLTALVMTLLVLTARR